MINQDQLERSFDEANLDVKFVLSSRQSAPYLIDVKRDRKGEHFEIRYTSECPELRVLDIDKKHKHILLHDTDNKAFGTKLLLGHDERHLFVSNVDSSARTIPDALLKLAPQPLSNSIKGQKKWLRNIWKRRTKRYTRQGEWFFIPVPDLVVPEDEIVHNEPIQRRATSKPHICQDMYRYGGEAIYVVLAGRKTHQFTHEQYVKFMGTPEAKGSRIIRQGFAGANVFVRGKISHPDHSSIELQGWHSVSINREMVGNKGVAFLD